MSEHRSESIYYGTLQRKEAEPRGARRHSTEPFSCWAIWKGNKKPGLGTLVLCLFMIWFSLTRFCPLFTPSSPEWTSTLAGLPFLQAPCYNLVWESLYVYFMLTFCGTLHYFKPTSTYVFFFLKSRLAPLSSAGVGGGVPSSKWHVAHICDSCLCQSLWPGDVALALFRALCE